MTFENDTFETYKDARQHMLGSEDTYRYYNPKTGRPIKKLMNYTEVILYSENYRMGYKGMAWLKKVSKGQVIVRKELFDQNGDDFRTFNEMWEAFQMFDFQR
jgi:hypothetical protein